MSSGYRQLGILSAIASACALVACGGGSNSGGGSTAAQNASIQGTVASGNAVPNALVAATDVHGATASATADANGNYTLDTTKLSAPVALVATDPTGLVGQMVTVLPSLPAAGGTSVANVTTLTTALAALQTPDGNALDFVTSGAPASLASLASITPAGAQKASATLDTYLGNLLSANGVTGTFDAVSTPFTANHTGADAVIDLVQIEQQGTATYLASKLPLPAGTTQGAGFLTLSTAGENSPPPPLAAPPAAFATNFSNLSAYLAALAPAMTACLTGANSSACSAVFDAAYLDNGYTNIQQFDTDLKSTSLALGTPQIVLLAADGSSATIRVPYSLGTGTSASQFMFATRVQAVSKTITLPGGAQVAWDVIGNQLKYDISAQTRVTRRMFFDTFVNSTGSADVNFYDAGVNLNVNLLGPNGTNLYSALVTGPGLPSGGLYMMRTSVVGDNALTIPGTQPSSPPKSPALAGNSTNEFRWSWATVSPSATFTPPKRGFWSTAPLDVSTLPADPTYTFTLYDSSGNQLDQVSVVNVTPPADATVGGKTAWATIGGDVVSNFLSANGSEAGAVSSVPVDFTPASGQPSLYQVMIQSLDSTGNGALNVAPLPSGATSLTVNAPTGTPFQAVNTSTGTFRIVQLRGKDPYGVRFWDNQTFRNGSNAPDAF
ncbi:carboxypeptidase-like regulatory domain-containing protein [Burkholderia guangdongensis]|uniref:carboxypeptidase-like regulatory domain-containing protein n=1 Tax=Burkholderia guangdongensis TaxID=1792500 RepID=UPI0015CBB2F9|nr:carboxypeptidase-like regulatory domain-containing protein [Burkholderia guangdongensis]